MKFTTILVMQLSFIVGFGMGALILPHTKVNVTVEQRKVVDYPPIEEGYLYTSSGLRIPVYPLSGPAQKWTGRKWVDIND